MRKSKGRRKEIKRLRQWETYRQRYQAGHFDCPKCGASPAQQAGGSGYCCDYCGASCGLQEGCSGCHLDARLMEPEGIVKIRIMNPSG